MGCGLGVLADLAIEDAQSFHLRPKIEQYLPLSFITGFFGMNFAWLTGHITSFWVFATYGLGSLLAFSVAIYVWFRRGGHLGST
jgi:hypothetical protein